jgi:O-antigen ligase
MEWIFLAYALWALLAVGQAVETRPALEGAKRIVVFLLAFLAGRRVLGRDRARPLLRVLAVLAVLIAGQLLFLLVSRGYSIALLTTHLGKLTDVGWGRSNYVAATAALAASAAISLALFGRGAERLLGALGILAAVFVEIATVSRGGAVALASGILLATALEGRRRLLPALLLAAASVAAYLASPLGQAGIARFVHPEELPSVGVRFLFFREALEVARSHWLLGAGPDQIPFHSAFYVDANPHNIFLKNAADLGLAGLLLYSALLALLARAAVRLRRAAGADRDARLHALALALSLGVAVVNACYEPTLEGPEYGFLFWLLAGALTDSARRPGDLR